jgi:hypothetical protein
MAVKAILCCIIIFVYFCIKSKSSGTAFCTAAGCMFDKPVVDRSGNAKSVNNCMERSFSRKTSSSSAIQETPDIVWNPVQNSRLCPPFSARWISSMHFRTQFINYNIIIPSTPRSCKWSLSSDFHTNILYAFFSSPTRATYATHLLALVRLL